MPVRQTFVFDVVGKADIASAVALNVGMFNSARVIGPALAGGIISLFGFPIGFFLNGVSFIAVIFALFKMRTKKFMPKRHPHPLKQLLEGIHFSMKHPIISTLLIILGFLSFVPWAYNSIMPAVARQIYHTGSGGYGILVSAAGLGALCAAVFVSRFSEKLNLRKTIRMMITLSSLSLLAFSYAANFLIGFALLFILGFSLLTQVSLINATIQRNSPDYIRGRVMGVYALMFLGILPLGGLTMGTTASFFGIPTALRLSGTVTLAGTAVYLFFLKHRLTNLPR
jgi:predicted MFS family arabinose efflux permease